MGESGRNPGLKPIDREAARELLRSDRPFTRDELATQFARAEIDPIHDEARACAMLVPAEWDELVMEAPAGLLAQDDANTVPLGAFHPEGDQSIVIQVQYVRPAAGLAELPPESVAGYYVKLLCETSGMELLVAQQVELDSGAAVEAIARGVDEGRGVFTRFLAMKEGEILFLVTAACPERRWATWRDTLAVCLRSFAPGA